MTADAIGRMDLFLRRLYGESRMCEPYPRPEFHETVMPDGLLEYPDVWLEQLPGWITTHTLAHAGYYLVVRQKHYPPRAKALYKICARLTPSVHRVSGIRISIRSQRIINSMEEFFKILLTNKLTAIGFSGELKFIGVDKASEDYILDNYKFETLLERHNERKLATMKRPLPRIDVDAEEVLAKIA